jgi:hypothetical protein
LVSDLNDKLAALRQKTLERDDETDPNGRIYRDKVSGEIYYSVTRILGETASKESKEALAKWLERPGAAQNRDAAAARGTSAHNHLEYLTKTASRLVRSTANKRGVWKSGSDGLYRAPEGITTWALTKALQGAPRPRLHSEGWALCLRGYLLDRISAIHSTEFSIHHIAGFAGTCDLLADVKHPESNESKLTLLDWKTTGRAIHRSKPEHYENYRAQLGAYSLGLKARTGIQAEAGVLVIGRQSGQPQEIWLEKDELLLEEDKFLARCVSFFEHLPY